MDTRRLTRLATTQRGLFTRTQARECGFSAGQIRRRVGAGTWRRVLGSVLALPGVRSTQVLRDRAAHLAVPGSVIAGPSAARLWGLAVPDGEPYLIVNPQHHPRVPGIRFLRIKLDRRDVQSFGGAAVTSKERTFVDCLRLLPDAAAMDLLDRALQRRLISVDGLVERVLSSPGVLGRRRACASFASYQAARGRPWRGLLRNC